VQRLARDVAIGDHDLGRPERPDPGGGIAEVLALQPRQAVDLQGEDEHAEAERDRRRPARPPHPEAGADHDQQRHERRQQVAAVEVVFAERRGEQPQGDRGAADQGRDPGAAALVRIATPDQERRRRKPAR
jgi:hypothetical protein